MEYAAAASTLARRQAILNYLMPYMITSLLVSILIYVASSIGLWNIFVKSGEKGWKGFIPFYRFYVLYKICWKPLFFWINLALLCLVMVFGNMRAGGMLVTIFAVVVVLFTIAWFVIFCISMYKLAKVFGKGGGFTVGLILLNVVFLLILAFGSAKNVLIGKNDSTVKVNAGELINGKNIKSLISKKETKKVTPVKEAEPAKRPSPAKKVAPTKRPSARKATPKKKQPDYIDPKPKAHF